MQSSIESDRPSPSTLHLVDLALQMLKVNVEKQIEQGIRLDRLYQGWHQSWLSQYEQLRGRIETLESRMAPWINERASSPQLCLISQQEDAA